MSANGSSSWRRNRPPDPIGRFARPQPEIATEPPNTIARDARAIYFNSCNPALATLADGDALVACALNGQIQLYRLDRDTGEQTAARLPLPECQRDHPAALFLMVRRDGAMLLGGSRPGNNVAGNCSWLGRPVMQTE